MFRRCAFPIVPLKIVCKLAEYPRHLRVADLGCEAAALFLYFRQGLCAIRHDSGKLKLLDARNY
jgi:hypothetical protein